MQRADARLAGGRRRAGTGAGRQGTGPAADRLDHLSLASAAPVGGDDVIAVIGRPGRYGQARSGVLPVASLLLLRLVLLGAIAGHVAEAGWQPVEVLLQVAAAAAAAARLEREIVALLGPEILVTLTLGPAARATAALEVRQYRLLPGVEALAMHKLAHRAVVVVAGDLDSVVQGVQADESVAAQALAGRRAASRRLGRVTQQIVHGIVDPANGAPVLQEAATAVAAVGVTPRCHRCRGFAQGRVSLSPWVSRATFLVERLGDVESKIENFGGYRWTDARGWLRDARLSPSSSSFSVTSHATAKYNREKP